MSYLPYTHLQVLQRHFEKYVTQKIHLSEI